MRFAFFLLLSVLLAACASRPPAHAPQDEGSDYEEFPEDAPLKPVARLDLPRYMGRWYIIANIPYFAESGNVAPYVEYTLRPDGIIDDLYTARDGFDEPPFTKKGEVMILDRDTNAQGQISFLPPLWLDYTVVYLDRHYRYTAIAHPSRSYAWIFSREPRMDETVYAEALAALKDNGFDVDRVLKIPHAPEQVGLPGYQ